jgi:hypothetical protein
MKNGGRHDEMAVTNGRTLQPAPQGGKPRGLPPRKTPARLFAARGFSVPFRRIAHGGLPMHRAPPARPLLGDARRAASLTGTEALSTLYAFALGLESDDPEIDH